MRRVIFNIYQFLFCMVICFAAIYTSPDHNLAQAQGLFAKRKHHGEVLGVLNVKWKQSRSSTIKTLTNSGMSLDKNRSTKEELVISGGNIAGRPVDTIHFFFVDNQFCAATAYLKTQAVSQSVAQYNNIYREVASEMGRPFDTGPVKSEETKNLAGWNGKDGPFSITIWLWTEDKSSVVLACSEDTLWAKYTSTHPELYSGLAQERPQESSLPRETEIYSFGDLPLDGQPHWMQPLDGYAKRYGVGYKIFLGKGEAQTIKEGKENPSKFAGYSSFILDGVAHLTLVNNVNVTSNGSKNRSLMVYLQVAPDEGETLIGSTVLDIDNAQKFLYQLGDLLRIGRKWKNEGNANEDKKVTLSTIKEVGLDRYLTVAIEKSTGSSAQGWYLWTDRAVFYNPDLADLSQFRDNVDSAVKWMERQR